jgi:hypothetical protein
MDPPSKATGEKPYQDMDADEKDPLTGHLGQTEKYSRFKPRQQILPWFISLLLLIALVYSRINRVQPSDDRGSWRMTELGITCPHTLSPGETIQSCISANTSHTGTLREDVAPSLHPVRFDATLRYNESHKLYRPRTFPEFVGEPNQDIDRAWEDLMGGKRPPATI